MGRQEKELPLPCKDKEAGAEGVEEERCELRVGRGGEEEEEEEERGRWTRDECRHLAAHLENQ